MAIEHNEITFQNNCLPGFQEKVCHQGIFLMCWGDVLPPENIRYLLVFWYFQGVSKKQAVWNGLMTVFTLTHPVNTCLKLTIETLEQGVKYVQS